MKYKVYFINRAFREVLNRDILVELIEKEEDEYRKKQLSHLLDEVPFSAILEKAKEYFYGRDDLAYSSREIILNNRVTNNISRIFYEDNSIYVDANDEKNHIITFLNSNFRPVALIKMDEDISKQNIK